MNGASEIFTNLMTANEIAFEKKNFDAAYHFLAAATHVAEASGNEEQLSLVEEKAQAELQLIDEFSADYPHSSKSARERHRDSIFSQLAETARIARKTALMHQKRGLDGLV